MKRLIVKTIFALGFLGVLLSPRSSFSQVSVQDSLVLVEFYNATNGPNWINHTNWLITSVNNWYGIMLWDEYVGKIELPTNNLSGYISPLLGQLNYLYVLNLSGNNITGQIPEWLGNCHSLGMLELQNNFLTGNIPQSLGNCYSNLLNNINISNNMFNGNFPDTLINNAHLRYIWISNNKFSSFHLRNDTLVGMQIVVIDSNQLTFKDVIPYITSNHPPNWLFKYSPQDSILNPIDTTVLLGSTLVLDAWVDSCQGNVYRWRKDADFLSILPNASSQHVINNIQYSDSGYYSCDVTNPTAWLLYLHRRLIHVHVTDAIGIAENQISTEIQITQNQKEEMLNIIMDFKSTTHVNCDLYDVNGRHIMRLYEGITRKQDFHYKLNRLKKGVYVIRTVTPERTESKKIVVF